MQNDLLQLLIDAKLAGSSREGGGYWFRSNEEAAELALDVLGVWLEEHAAMRLEELVDGCTDEARLFLSLVLPV